jgi:hypothetical protein
MSPLKDPVNTSAQQWGQRLVLELKGHDVGRPSRLGFEELLHGHGFL